MCSTGAGFTIKSCRAILIKDTVFRGLLKSVELAVLHVTASTDAVLHMVKDKGIQKVPFTFESPMTFADRAPVKFQCYAKI